MRQKHLHGRGNSRGNRRDRPFPKREHPTRTIPPKATNIHPNHRRNPLRLFRCEYQIPDFIAFIMNLFDSDFATEVPVSHYINGTRCWQSDAQSIVGSLMWAALGTRPDIAYAVAALSMIYHQTLHDAHDGRQASPPIPQRNVSSQDSHS